VHRTLPEVMDEVKRLAADGFAEIEFLGQNVNGWLCPETGAGLGDLLRAAGSVSGIRRIRMTTSHPLHLSSPIMQAIADVPAVCNALHLPVQSGSSRVLRRMRRGYDRSLYLEQAAALRRLRPDFALSTDIIVGFPGETEADFRETISLLEQARFDQVYSFVYSPRPGTRAAEMPDDTPPQRKAERLLEVQQLQRTIQLEIHRARLGRIFEVLVESPSRRSTAEWAGRTTCNRVVNFAAPGARPGDALQVRITAAGPNSLRGEPAPRPDVDARRAGERVDHADPEAASA
jgi:tRNA-2-methylthio-N6-dimethylallyladenosine synthase